MSERFRLEYPQAKVLPLSFAFMFVLGIFMQGGLRLFAIAVGVLGLLLWVVMRRFMPALVVDDSGYAVEKLGREKLRVGWGEVLKVRADAAEEALYVDAGDPARNLLVPPRRGFGFRFESSPRLFRLVLQKVAPEKV